MKIFRSNCPFHRGDSGSSFCVYEDEHWYCHNCHVHGGRLLDLYMQLYDIDDLDDDCSGGAEVMLLPFRNDTDGSYDIEAVLKDLTGDCYTERGLDRPDVLAANLAAAKDYARGDFHGDPLAFTDWKNPHTPGMFHMMMRGFLPETMYHDGVADWERWVDHPIFLPLAFNDEVYGYQLKGYDESVPRFITMEGVTKSDQVYGYSPKDAEWGLLIEGKTDQLMAWQYNWREDDGFASFAMLGSNLSLAQAKMVAHHCKRLLIATDMDDAGKSAYEWAVLQMRPFLDDIRRLVLPRKDIGLTNRKQFYAAIRKAVPELSWFGKPKITFDMSFSDW